MLNYIRNFILKGKTSEGTESQCTLNKQEAGNALPQTLTAGHPDQEESQTVAGEDSFLCPSPTRIPIFLHHVSDRLCYVTLD
jgi:hypothetical protein